MHLQRRGEETRNRILRAAEEGFAQNGYEATGVAEICQRAHLSKGAFYHHFPSKQAVFLALLDRWLDDLETHLQDLRAQAASAPEALMQMADVAREVFHAARGRLPVFLEFLNKAARDPRVWQATITPYRRYRAFFAGLLEAGMAEGSLRRVDAEAAANAFLSLAVGLVLQGVVDPDGADWGDIARESVRLFLDGLRRPEARAVGQ
ncbi:MAG: TetR/AcrR family transcriptional regulator [Anaerolineae bacterium]